MQDKTAQQIKNTEWANWLLEELVKRSGRNDIEVKVTAYSNHDVLISAAADKHPIVSFYSAIQGDPSRVEPTLDYTSEMLKDWELTTVLHEKANKDCLPFYERLKGEFPHMGLVFTIADTSKHCTMVSKKNDKIAASFDLWPRMTEDDIKRLISHIRELEATLHQENATYAEMNYWWA